MAYTVNAVSVPKEQMCTHACADVCERVCALILERRGIRFLKTDKTLSKQTNKTR